MSTKTANFIEHGLWRIDRSRSTIAFRVRHFGVATVRGHFESFACRLEADDDGLRVEGDVDVGSVDTGHGIRDARLRSEFFDVERHAAISLRASAAAGDRRLAGELTIRGVTRPIELALTVDVDRDGTARLCGDGSIRRSDFGLEWDALRQAGRLLVADEVRLRADVVFARS
jgi:polyisoprenoid-binding protein YceI